MDVGYVAAALGGLISFLSPCVLPLVPAYLCFVAGTSLEELTREDKEGKPPGSEGLTLRVTLGATGFVLGFTTVFVALGASASAINPLILQNKVILTQIAGAIIIVFGLHYMGLFRIALLNRDARFHLRGNGEGERSLPMQFASPYLLGLAFAFGWTPCIGPILGAVLAVAASEETLGYGMSLLAAYSLGLGIPFLIAAFGIRGFMAFMRRFRQHMHKVEIATGSLLILTGLAIFSGQL
ncbi:MAG TPA: cytochrome C biogenesis protein, partial [Rhodobiaceae bacterium]|nr:cytochrome C biogenesis protein [Rhodobiaceae bacterium]